MSGDSHLTFHEFFAGGGMARLGLGPAWRCVTANDFDAKKCAAYRANFGGDHLIEGDVAQLTAGDLPGEADLAWASFPCQDLSLAGLRGGLKSERSGAFFAFWNLMQDLRKQERGPRLIVLENVSGLLNSRKGEDFAALCAALAEGGYRVGALEIDAIRFLPQSRPRLFVVAQRADLPLDPALIDPNARLTIPTVFQTPAVQRAARALPEPAKSAWVNWRLPEPPDRETQLADIVERGANDWFNRAETDRILEMMSAAHIARVWERQEAGGVHVGALYRRTRNFNGKRVQRAEVRFDGVAGCLRTPGGGSSRQFIMVIKDGKVGVRRMSARESARLMGLPEDYVLPGSDTAALHVTGDGVAVPVVAWLAEHLLTPLLTGSEIRVAA